MKVYHIYYNKRKGFSLGLSTFEAIQATSEKEAREKFLEKFPGAEILNIRTPRR